MLPCRCINGVLVYCKALALTVGQHKGDSLSTQERHTVCPHGSARGWCKLTSAVKIPRQTGHSNGDVMYNRPPSKHAKALVLRPIAVPSLKYERLQPRPEFRLKGGLLTRSLQGTKTDREVSRVYSTKAHTINCGDHYRS